MAAKRQGWRSYAAGSEAQHFAKFAREHLTQSEDRWEGQPLKLEPWQRRMLAERWPTTSRASRSGARS
jgi:hypothetical protein